MSELLLNNQAAKATGLTPRQVQSWTDKGLIKPKREASGGGSKRGYDFLNLVELSICKKLFDSGHGIQAVKAYISATRDHNTLANWINDPKEYCLNQLPYESFFSYHLDVDGVWEKWNAIYQEAERANHIYVNNGFLIFVKRDDNTAYCAILPGNKFFSVEKASPAAQAILNSILEILTIFPVATTVGLQFIFNNIDST